MELDLKTIEEAITHEETVCSDYERLKNIRALDTFEVYCLEYHRQLVEWLEDYKRLLEQKKTEVIFTGTRIHYELRNKNSNFRFHFKFDEQKSQEGIRNWFKENRSSVYFPSGKYVIVKVTETEKAEVVEELEEVE